MSNRAPFTRNPAIDAAVMVSDLRDDGRMQCADFLARDAAAALHNDLRARADWVQVLNSGEKVIELPRPLRATLSAEKQAELDTAVFAGARYGFQYRYESIRVADDDARGRDAADGDLVIAFAQFMNAPEQIALWREILGVPSINFVDAQATAFAPGDFLTGHDDAVMGKGRHAAYVFSLNPVWRIEWGGLLLFHAGGTGQNGGRVAGFAPGFNCLNMFTVPTMHSVSAVTRAAANRRYSITGWIRTV